MQGRRRCTSRSRGLLQQTGLQRQLAAGLCLLLLGLSACRADLVTEADALLAFSNEITNWGALQSANDLGGWSAATALSTCNWTLVTCNTARTQVIGLSLDGSQLSVTPEGTLSPALANLTALQTLSIANTQLGGNLAEEWALPGTFTHLTTLSLTNNTIDGTIPLSWGQAAAFTNLLTLALDANELSGTLHPEWSEPGTWTNLNSLSISGNHLTGSVPAEWGSDPNGGLIGINNITLSHNQFSGTLPLWNNSGLYQLSYLDVSSNFLTGTLVSEWSSVSGISRLQTLMLQDNDLSGPLPSAWGNRNQFTALTYLDLSGNQISGSFPKTWNSPGALPALYQISLDHNPFSGTLPAEWANASVMPALGIVSIVNASLRGSLPEAWAGHNNQAGLSNLYELYLGYNPDLTGTLPASWGNGSWQSLSVLSLPYAGIYGPLPNYWGSNAAFPQLASLELTGNFLTGTLPPAWGNDTNFDFLRLMLLGDNMLDGSLPDQWGGAAALPSVRQLDLHGNNFTGPIPASWAVFQVSISIWLQPGNEGICGPAPSNFYCSLPEACSPTSIDVNSVMATCECNPFEITACPAGTPGTAPAPTPGFITQVQGVNSTLELIDFPLASWTATQADTLVQSIMLLIAEPELATTDFNVSRVYDSHRPASRRLLSSLWDSSSGHRFGRMLLQAPPSSDTAVNMLINIAGQEEYSQVQDALRNMTASSDNGTLYRQLSSTGQFPGLTAVSLQSVDSIQVQLATPPAPGSTRKPPSGAGISTGALAGAIVGCVLGIALVTLAITLASYRIHKRRRQGLDKAKVSTTSSQGFFDSARHHSGSSGEPGLKGANSHDLKLAFSDWLVSPDEIEICTRHDGSYWHLGSGGFGCVYKGVRGGVTTVAVKVMGETHAEQQQANRLMEQTELFEREIHLLKSCRDRNIVQFLGACMQPGKLMLITEYLEGGDLFSALERDHTHKFSWWKAGVKPGEAQKVVGLNKRIALDVARGLAFLHHRKVVHRDLKSPNILLARDGTAKLADVGLAKVLKDNVLSTLQGQLGTFAWAAPEVLLGRECSEKVDIYSFGVVLWELSTGMQPNGRFLRPVVPGEECPEEIGDLIRRCLNEQPVGRPSAVEIVHYLDELR